LVTTTIFPLACLTGHHLPPDLVRTWSMSPCTPVHLACAYCVLYSPQNTSLHPAHSLFFVPYSHWNWCFHRSRRVFRAVIVSAGSPPTQLHTCTTTFLTLLSFSFCVQSSGRNYSTHSIWVASAKAQKKVHNKFFLTFHYCPPLAPFHTHCLTHLPPFVFTLTLVSSLSASKPYPFWTDFWQGKCSF
jgi:hypothetical protein